MKMEGRPELKIEKKDPEAIEAGHDFIKQPDYQGGADEMGASKAEKAYRNQQAVKEARQNVEDKMGDTDSESAATSTSEGNETVTLDISALDEKIEKLQSGKMNFLQKTFGDPEETLRRLRIAKNKITNPEGSFARDYMAAKKQGGDKFALKYAEAIGKGDLVRPENGRLMMSGKRNQEMFFPQ